MNDFEEINLLLGSMVDKGFVEPIDDPNLEINFWDWADIVGIVDEFVPYEHQTA